MVVLKVKVEIQTWLILRAKENYFRKSNEDKNRVSRNYRGSPSHFLLGGGVFLSLQLLKRTSKDKCDFL